MACSRIEEKRNAYRILVGKPERKRPRRKWVNNIKMDLKEIWIGLIWLRIETSEELFLNTVMNFWVP
jgi:hypothetical protein